jgi:hypothetical protein
MSKTLINKCQSATIIKNGKEKQILLFDCVECEQAIPYGAKDFHKETETEIRIICEECYKKEQPKKKRTSKTEMDERRQMLVELYLKENWKKSVEVFTTAVNTDYTEARRQEVIQAFYNPINEYDFTQKLNRFVWGYGYIGVIHTSLSRFNEDPRTENTIEFGYWSYRKLKELGLPKMDRTYTHYNIELEKFYSKWERIEDMIAFLEEEDFCLK